MSKKIRNWKKEYPFLPKHIPNSQYEVVMRKAKGHSNGYIAKELGVSEAAVAGRIHRFKKANPEYGDNFQSIVNANTRLRESFHNINHNDIDVTKLDTDNIQEKY